MNLRVLFTFFIAVLMLPLYGQIASVGLIGDATPGGWDDDTDMVRDEENPDLWTLDINLNNGVVKFRADDGWTINWGSTDFPIGVGTQDGPDIPVRAGQHHVTFNSATGEYYFSVASDIGIIGSASPFGWDADVNLYQDDSDPDLYSISLPLGSGEAKFRQDDDWAVNWGSTDFPSGIGVQDGPNIPVAIGGDYEITFNKATGEYSFVLTSYSTVGIIGDATPNGDTPTPMTSGSAPGSWTISVDLTEGGVQFSGDDGLAIWGGIDFPSGTAVLDGDPIQVPAGLYVVEFNTRTLAYEFKEVVFYNTIGIIGDATAGGWEEDTDMQPDPSGDPHQWTLRTTLATGEAKFRANDDWDVNWGAGTFPSGTATINGANIPVTEGEYIISFNSFTGQYFFFELRIYNSVGLVGTGSPSGSWDIDTELVRDETNENLWGLPEVEMLDGEAKFRAEGNWTVNWGTDSWPSGTGTQDGPNIPITGGTYSVSINTETGEYAFADPVSSTQDLLNPSLITVFPNPTVETLNINLDAIDMTGNVRVQVLDISGRVMLSNVLPAEKLLQVQLPSLPTGVYMLHLSNERYIIGKKFTVSK